MAVLWQIRCHCPVKMPCYEYRHSANEKGLNLNDTAMAQINASTLLFCFLSYCLVKGFGLDDKPVVGSG